MKPLFRILARLYPAAWRKRYGAEFEALIEDARLGLGGALDILRGAFTMQLASWTPLRVLAISAVAGVLTATGIAFAIPTQYSSAAVIAADRQGAGPFDQKTLERMFGRSSLTKIIRDKGMFRDDATKMSIEDVVERFKSDLQISPAVRGYGVGYQVRFVSEDRYLAQQVAQTVAISFVEAQPEFHLVKNADLPLQPINAIFSA